MQSDAEALDITDLNGGALFCAQFVTRNVAAPYRKGRVLHSVSAAAMFFYRCGRITAAISPITDGLTHTLTKSTFT
jgi:hypothetical protein